MISLKSFIPFFGRQKQFDELESFAKSPKAGFVFLRGRRRVGKSRLLQKFCRNNTVLSFYFMAKQDATDQSHVKDFALEWDLFLDQRQLSEIQPHFLTWKRLFGEITKFAQKANKPLLLCFDEIQWLCKKGSGVAGAIKEAWLDWEQLSIKVIICGSSTKFFKQTVEGNEKILRGLKTRSDIFVPEFTPGEIQEYYFPHWSLHEIALTYMMLGGLPHYLNQIDAKKNFITAINDAIFLKDSIFCEEVNEILNLEFNKMGIKTAMQILSILGQEGKEHSKIVKETGKSSSTVSEMIEKLLAYQIVFEKEPLIKPNTRKKNLGPRYFMKDFYLNFYFQILLPLENQIKTNQKALLFATKCLASEKGFYIPNFSGKAFELFVQRILENRFSTQPNIFTKLDIRDPDYQVGTYWDQTTQIDLVVENKNDRLTRLIECKWINQENISLLSLIQDITKKTYPLKKHWKKQHYLMLSQDVSLQTKEKAKAMNCEILELKDLTPI
jgi:AAA+ ATPase superfamily predicted ATPase